MTNWTYGDPRVRFRVPVGVAYGSDIDKVRKRSIAVGREHPQALQDPAPSVFLKQFGDSSIDFELVVWSEEMSHRPARFKSDLNFLIEKKFREAGIEIPFPQRDLHIRSGVAADQSAETPKLRVPSMSLETIPFRDGVAEVVRLDEVRELRRVAHSLRQQSERPSLLRNRRGNACSPVSIIATLS